LLIHGCFDFGGGKYYGIPGFAEECRSVHEDQASTTSAKLCRDVLKMVGNKKMDFVVDGLLQPLRWLEQIKVILGWRMKGSEAVEVFMFQHSTEWVVETFEFLAKDRYEKTCQVRAAFSFFFECR